MTMRERMARAMIAEFQRQADDNFDYCTSTDAPDDISLDGCFDFYRGIDAILAEMETPSDEVLDASDCECGNSSDYLDFRRNDFCAMIRAIRDGK